MKTTLDEKMLPAITSMQAEVAKLIKLAEAEHKRLHPFANKIEKKIEKLEQERDRSTDLSKFDKFEEALEALPDCEEARMLLGNDDDLPDESVLGALHGIQQSLHALATRSGKKHTGLLIEYVRHLRK